MTNQQEAPEALRLAELLELAPEDGVEPQTAEDAAAELRRLHAENEALREERERNLDSIRVNNEIINKQRDENETLHTGYAAARLEIESLQARIKAMAEEHADELMVAHLDGRMRAAQPAGAQQPGDCGNTPYDEGPFTLAQQPGAAYAALPDADRDYMRKVVAVAVTMLFDGYKEDVTRVFSLGELSEFVTITAAMRVEKVEDIYRRAWDLLSLPASASHGQAPAQAAPQPSPTPQADSQPAPVREEEREAFKAAHRHLELDEVPDAWGRPMFKYSHVEASWLGWIARAARAPAGSVTAPATAAVAGPSEAVAYLDIGAGGYLDLGSALSDEALQQLPKGRHALVIAGNYGIDGYVAAPQQETQEPVMWAMWRESTGWLAESCEKTRDECIANCIEAAVSEGLPPDFAATRGWIPKPLYAPPTSQVELDAAQVQQARSNKGANHD